MRYSVSRYFCLSSWYNVKLIVCKWNLFGLLSREKSGGGSEERWRQSNLSCFQTAFNENGILQLQIILIYSDNTYIEWINIFFTNDRLVNALFVPPPILPPTSAWPYCRTSYYGLLTVQNKTLLPDPSNLDSTLCASTFPIASSPLFPHSSLSMQPSFPQAGK